MSQLRIKLKDFRYKQSKIIDKPAYVIFSNKTMENIIDACPRSLSSLQRVKGIGPTKVKTYGAAIIKLVKEHGSSSSSSSSSSTTSQSLKRSAPSFSKGTNSNVRIAIKPTSTTANVPKPIIATELTADQLSIAQRVINGESIFLTGPAGSGKSYLFRYLIQELKKKFPQDESIAITAPTGIAAINVNGQTIHSWAGVGLGKGDVDKLVAKVNKSNKVFSRWSNVKVLLIDEVSMLSSDLFQKLAMVGARVRNRPISFGGIQLVCCGDFFQLPPVGLGKWADFCFKTDAWSKMEMATCALTQVIRQSGDTKFVSILNELRIGHVNQNARDLFRACHINNKPFPKDGIIPTKLFCTNRDVDSENATRLQTLKTQAMLFSAYDELDIPTANGDATEKEIKLLQEAANAKVPFDLTLKVGAQIVLLRNLRSDLVNGSRGKIIGWQDISVEFSKNINKRQKTTTDSSSSTSNEYEILWSGRDNQPNGRLLQMLTASSEPVLSPIIQFSNGRVVTIPPFEFFIGLGSKGSVIRLQLPLKLAWALTVHKSQGMTLSRCMIQASDAFECGQVYVAISRCVSTEGLWICGGEITEKCVKAHPDVLNFLNITRK